MRLRLWWNQFSLVIAYITFPHLCDVHRQKLHWDDSDDALQSIYSIDDLQGGRRGGVFFGLLITTVANKNRLTLK